MKVRVSSAEGVKLFEGTVHNFPAVVGRDPAHSVPIADGSVSSRHVEIHWNGTTVTVRDLGSRNGLFFNGDKIPEKTCSLPCSFRLGSGVVLKLAADGEEFEDNSIVYSPTPDMYLSMAPKPTLLRPHLFKPTKPVELKHSAVAVSPGWSWNCYWKIFHQLSARQFLLFFIGWGLVISLLDCALSGDSIPAAMGLGFGGLFVIVCAGAIASSIWALFGLLFRGSYDFKPLFYAQSLAAPAIFLQACVLQSLFLHDFWSLPAQMFSFVLVSAASIVIIYMVMFTIFPHRWNRRLAFVTFFFVGLSLIGVISDVVLVPKQKLLRRAFLGQIRASRDLAGAPVSVGVLAQEMRAPQPANRER